MEKSSYQKLREKVDYIDFMSKHMIENYKEDLTGDYDKDRRTKGFIAALEMVQEWLHKNEKSDN